MSFRLAIVAVLLLVAAGCVAPGGVVSPTPGDAATAVDMRTVNALVHVAGDNLSAKAATGVLATILPIGHDAGEPTLGLTKDGTIFYAAITFKNDLPGGQPRTDILSSADAGKTWKDVTPFLPGNLARAQATTGDPMVYVDPATDRVFDIDQQQVACYLLTYSDDKGKTWVGPNDACFDAPADHQTVVAAKPRQLVASPLYPNAVYVCYNQITNSLCVRSLDGGLHFQPTTPPYTSPPGAKPNETDPSNPDVTLCSGLVGHLKTAPDGTIYLPRRDCDRPVVAVTQDDGVSWNAVQVSPRKALNPGGATNGSDPAVAVDAKGIAYYLYQAYDGHLYLHFSTDAGKHWNEGVDVTAPGLTATHLPSLIAGDEGRLAMVYMGSDVPGGYASDTTPVMENATWDGFLAVITGANTPSPTVTTTRVNDHADPLARGRCGPDRCLGIYDFLDVQVDKDGRPWAAFVDDCVGKCAATGGTTLDRTRGPGAGMVATLVTGPGLKAGEDALPPLHAAGAS